MVASLVVVSVVVMDDLLVVVSADSLAEGIVCIKGLVYR